MAITLPETIPTKASEGERRLFNLLKTKLPEDFIVWYEPRLNRNLYPDFIVLGPSFGLLILEVKGWRASQVVEAGERFFRIEQKDGHIESQRSPMRQAFDYFGTAADRLKSYAILRQDSGDYEGKLAFPVGVGAVLSNITQPQAYEEAIDPFLERPYITYRDELLDWESLSSDELVQRLREMFKVKFDFPTLTPDQISTIKGCLHPETVIKTIPAPPTSVPKGVTLAPDSTVVVGLDIEQERLAREMKEGHRLISGVAGSGKTLILLARAKVLANRLLEHRVLILCFNVTLAAHLRSLLHSDTRNPQYQERIEIMHFHAWAKSLLGRLPHPREFNDDESYNQFLGQQVLMKLQSSPPEQHYDSILVDEAHTFSFNWFECCVAALKDSENGDLLIVSDGSQSLYKRRKFTWKSVGIKAQGRSQRLTQNYRNTQEILTAAWNVLQPTSSDEDATFPAVEPAAALRHGPEPTLHVANSKAAAVDAVVEKVRSLCNQGYSPADIAIVYRWKGYKEAAAFDSLLQHLQQLDLCPYWITEDRDSKHNYDANQPGVRIITALSSLGLEFKVVLLLWLEQFADCSNKDVETAALARRQLYVAMTRSQDELHLFAGGRSQLVNTLH
ncbi:UvrD-helicase domain-containing protein [Sphaerothrix gracilis]|uniref:UvrD-helicase domain-containing protein n=1 Tax=Sphaerothrix gracilis TaxID=3151835 RepID=UPI0031FCA9FE